MSASFEKTRDLCYINSIIYMIIPAAIHRLIPDQYERQIRLQATSWQSELPELLYGEMYLRPTLKLITYSSSAGPLIDMGILKAFSTLESKSTTTFAVTSLA
jgi:hypothetical protein